MRTLLVTTLFAVECCAQGVLLDRIAVVVEQSIIKDSDIDRDIRVTDFLNNEPLRIDNAAKKTAAGKLIDQVFLRAEIRQGSYPRATLPQAQAQLEALISQRFHSRAAFQSEVAHYGLDEQTLLDQFRWQLTVLGFIDARFRPAAGVTDEAADQYYREHEAALRKDHPKDSVADLHTQARDILAEEEINRLFFTWLDERRKSARIDFHEAGLT